MDASSLPRSYLKRANSFIGQEDVFGGGLNQNYQTIPYQTSLYWRFLYEQCGGVGWVVEDPSAGMKPIRHVLESLYSGEIVDINSSSSAIEDLPSIIDVALYKTSTCPFHSFDESLVHFARAIYLLRRADGRCPAPHPYAHCGFYDPGGLYSIPDAASYELGDEHIQIIEGTIPSNFGLDLLELSLASSVDQRPVKIIFKSTSGPGYEYHIELWGRPGQSMENNGDQYSPALDGPLFSERTHEGILILEFQKLPLEGIESLDLVITRLDTQENTANSGHYTIQVVMGKSKR
jgi:hypothetical protein